MTNMAADSANSSVLCVDIGGSTTKAGLLDPNGNLSHVASIPTRPDSDAFFRSLVELIGQTKASAEEASGRPPTQMGVALAGFLDEERSCLLYNSNLAWFEGYPLRQKLQDAFRGFTIELEVDSNAATIAEYRFGSGQGSRRFLCLAAGTGLGVGMTVDGVPLRFAYGCMGDIGHIIVLRDGPLCTCGGRGCAEALISANSLANEYKALVGTQRPISLRNVIEAALESEPVAISVLKAAGEWLGLAIASISNTFFPDHIAIAGGLSAAGDLVLQPAEQMFRRSACELARSKPTFSRAVLGPAATLIGAAWPFWDPAGQRSEYR
jgi:glucokinase